MTRRLGNCDDVDIVALLDNCLCGAAPFRDLGERIDPSRFVGQGRGAPRRR